jgi:acyl dehydratase
MRQPFDAVPPGGAPRAKTVVLPELPKPYVLYGRAATGVIKRNRAVQLPALRYVRPAVPLDGVAIDRYARVCGFIPDHGVPLTYPHLLAFPLHLMLLTDPAFPWSALGLVHISNRIEQRRPLSIGDVLRIEVEFDGWRRHDKGQAFALATRIYRRGEAVWDGDSLYLKRGAANPQGDAPPPLEYDRDALRRHSRWQLPPQLGRDYATVSGDYNPIHLTALSAKAFGFPRAIAHGMWTLARAASALQPPKPLASATLAGEFKTPMLLPGEATFWTASPSLITRDFEVRDKAAEKPHLRGTIEWVLR